MLRRARAFWVFAALVVAAACSSSTPDDTTKPDASNPPDADTDAAADTESDTATDSTTDAANDAVEDTSSDALGDAPSDTPDDVPPAPCLLPDLGLTVATLAGCDDPGSYDGPRGLARFDNPVNVVVGSGGETYVADFDQSRVRVVDATGTATTLVSRPDLRRPFGMALAADGSLYLETDDNDYGQHSISTGTIWKVNTKTGAASVIVRNIGRPRGLAVLPDGRVAMADQMHHVVELLNPVNGSVSVLAGAVGQAGHVNASGSAARFAQPYDVVVLQSGNLAVSDLDNHVVREVTLAGVVTDFAGSGLSGDADGPASSASFAQPKGLAVGPDGAVYVTDVGNFDVRRIRAGQVVKLAGSTPGWQDNDDPLAAKFYGLEGADVSGDGRLVLADGDGGDDDPFNRIRVIHLSSSALPP